MNKSKNWRTTVCGLVGGAATWASQADCIPTAWKPICAALAALSIALLGLHAQDCPPDCQGTATRVLKTVLTVAGCAALLGCSLAQFKLSLSNPAYGTLGVSIGGGSIGKQPPALPSPTPTNAPASVLQTNRT